MTKITNEEGHLPDYPSLRENKRVKNILITSKSEFKLHQNRQIENSLGTKLDFGSFSQKLNEDEYQEVE